MDNKTSDELRAKAEKLLSEGTLEKLKLDYKDAAKLIEELSTYRAELEVQNTELREAQTSLEHSRNRYFELFDLAPVGYLTLDQKGIILEANFAAAEMLDVGRSFLKNTPLSVLVSSGHKEIFFRHLETVLNSGNKSECELQMRKKDGATFHIRMTSSFVNSSPENPAKVFSTLVDITERKKVEADLCEAERRHRNVSNITSDIAYSCSKSVDTSYHIDWITGAVEQITGYSGDELKAQGCWRGLVIAEDLPVFDKHVAGVAPGETGFCELRLRHKSGRIVWISSSSKSVFDPSSEDNMRLYGGIKDITNQKMTFELLRQSEERFRVAAECASDDIYEWNFLTDKVTHYGKLYHALGYDLGNSPTSSKEWAGLVHPEDRERVTMAVERVLRDEEKVLNVEYRILCTDGTFSQVVDRGALVLDRHGKPFKWVGVISDITERRNSEEKNLRLAAIVEHSDDAIIGTTLDGIVTSWNMGAENIYGFSAQEIIGESISVTIPPDRLDEMRGFVDRIQRGEHVKHFQTVRRRKDGADVPVSLTISPIVGRNGEIMGSSAIARDMTEHVAAERQREVLQTRLFHLQKMKALGTLVGGIAHDFNNMLQAIMGYAELLLFDKGTEEPGYKELKTIIKTGEGGAELVRQLLAFAQESQWLPVDLDINQHVLNSSQLLSLSCSEQIELEFDLTCPMAFIRADPKQIDQILLNLVLNSSEAMPNGGHLNIETTNVSFEEEHCEGNHLIKPGKYVMISVKDRGRGMDEATVAKVFDPFFSTKQRGSTRGTGLGLSVVQGLVQKNGGHITCHSKPGEGTEFKVFFPTVTLIR